ncbi:MAG TPA: response regulator transcription factor [Anaerolineae bacterium]|nr:response regulator transcription factor [Anaerolineae bacterium]
MEDLQLIIVADDPLARGWWQQLLTNVDDCTVVAQINSTTHWPEEIETYYGDAVLWDLGWEAPDTLPDLTDLSLPTLALVADDETANLVWQANIPGILSRETSANELAHALRAITLGLTILGPGLRDAVSRDVTNWPWPEIPTLTPRETEVLQLIAQGLTNKAIAHQLDISDHTVKFHVNSAMSKLNAPSRTVAVVQATRLGLINI